MKKIRVGVAGYGTIGQRLADGVAMQEDMELVGVADVVPGLSIQALFENDMIGVNGIKYDLYLAQGADRAEFEKRNIPIAGTFEELVQKVDVMLDSAPAGVGKAPSHQAVDLMTIMPHVEATGILVHTPVTHGHIITVVAKGKTKITKEMALQEFRKHPRIRVVSIADGFKGNASLFKYARDLGNRRGDMYEIGLWEESIVETGDDIMYAINIPQESVTIPETIDAIRAATGIQLTREEGTAATNKYLGIGKNDFGKEYSKYFD